MTVLLQTLSDGAFHSSSELEALSGLSADVLHGELVEQAVERGLDLVADRDKGYCLSVPLSLLPSAEVMSGRIGLPCVVLDSIDSTNAEAQRLQACGAYVPPFAVTAERQLAGRGRRGRAWLSPYGENLYLSLAFSVTAGAQKLEGLSLTIGVALYRALSALGFSGLGLKWPNDVLLGGRKLVGILLELHGDPAKQGVVVVGVGVNVNMQGAEIDQAWTSLRMVAGRLLDRSLVMERVCREIQRCVALHMEYGFSALRGEWQAASAWDGLTVRLSSASTSEVGVLEGVDESGAVLLRQGDKVERFNGGELSLRLVHDS